MKVMSKAKRQAARREYIEERNRVFKSVGKQAGLEYCKIGSGVVDELGFLLIGVRPNSKKKR